jgi:hypothetical protein
MRRLACIVVALTVACGGCAKRDPSTLFAPETGTIVVDAFLIVGQDFPTMLLTETLAANAPYSLLRAALHRAQVAIYDSTGAAIYAEDRDRPGIYYRQSGSLSGRVQPSTVYNLEIRAADGRRVRAKTRTPASFYVPAWLLLDDSGTQVERHLATFDVYGDSVFSRPENQITYAQGLLEARFNPAALAGIQVGLFSRTPDSPLIIDPDSYSEADFARDNSSPPFTAREGNVRLPWFAIFYEGRYVIKIWSMDSNWFDFARTDPVLRGGGVGFGGQAGDNFERPIFHLEGGIGLFGSGSVDSVGVTIHPRPPAAR